MKILVTGGCGFIGSHIVDRLVSLGHAVTAYDILEPQVHGKKKPVFLNKGAEYIFADVRNKEKLKKALKGIEVVFHKAAQVGVGQSMYEIEKYVSHNTMGSAILLDLVVNTKNKIQKLIVASSMSMYGEGAYACESCGDAYPALRKDEQLAAREWELKCPCCQKPLKPKPTTENKPLMPNSIYATTKRCQEEMFLEIGRAYKLPAVALRYFNVYGPRQSLNNPYTGVAAIFLSQVKNGNAPLVFEDGKQTRDFIYVSDIVDANILAMIRKEADYEMFNIGTGSPQTIAGVAETIIVLNKREIAPNITNKFRSGDVRHCYADSSKIKTMLGFKPKYNFSDGMLKLMEWSDTQKAHDLTKKAHLELKKKGLTQ